MNINTNKPLAWALSAAITLGMSTPAFAGDKVIDTGGMSPEQIQQGLLQGGVMRSGDDKLGAKYVCDPFLGELMISNVDRNKGVINNHNFTRIVVADEKCAPRVTPNGLLIVRAGQQSARGNAASQWAAAIPGAVQATVANFTGAIRDLARDNDCCGSQPMQPVQILNQNNTQAVAANNNRNDNQTAVGVEVQTSGRCESAGEGGCQ